jgi:hypothetical protein
VSLGLGVVEEPPHEEVELKEEHVFALIMERDESRKHRRWVLDSGVTNHVTGSRSLFTEMGAGIRGSVRFGDGSSLTLKVAEPYCSWETSASTTSCLSSNSPHDSRQT